jgi:ribosomal protein S1
MTTNSAWEQLKQNLPVHTIVHGTVVRHAPFGVFVSVPGIAYCGLVQITDFKDGDRMTPEEYPEIGSAVRAVVLGYKDNSQQIWLGMRPSQFNDSDQKKHGRGHP